VAAFDVDPNKWDTWLGDVPVFSLSKLKEYIDRHHVNIGVLTVPADQAQETAELLMECGLLAIWNFAPKDLKLPEHVVVQRTDLATSFAVLSAKVRQKMSKKDLSSEMDDW
jgi:redox-sensing transcriptional repressor